MRTLLLLFAITAALTVPLKSWGQEAYSEDEETDEIEIIPAENEAESEGIARTYEEAPVTVYKGPRVQFVLVRDQNRGPASKKGERK